MSFAFSLNGWQSGEALLVVATVCCLAFSWFLVHSEPRYPVVAFAILLMGSLFLFIAAYGGHLNAHSHTVAEELRGQGFDVVSVDAQSEKATVEDSNGCRFTYSYHEASGHPTLEQNTAVAAGSSQSVDPGAVGKDAALCSSPSQSGG
jgi:hypothetical protein